MRQTESAEQEQQGSLPSGWVWARLRDIAELKGGLTKGQKRKPGERLRSVPYLRVANVQRGYLDLSETKEIEATEEEIEELRLRKGDLLFNEGGDRDKLGRGWIWQDELSECIHQNHVFRGRLLSPALQPKFVSWYSNSIGQRYFLEQGKQTTNLASINLTKLGALPVPVPPADEQRRIVAEIEKQLSDLDAGVAALKRVRANLKRYRASVLKAACEGRLVPTEAELARAERRDYEPADKLLERILKERRVRWEANQLAKIESAGVVPNDESWKAKYQGPDMNDCSQLPSLPEGWCWASVDMVGDVLLGRQRAPQYLTGRFSRPYLRVANVKDDALDLSDIEAMDFDEEHFRKYSLRSGDILVSEGQSPELVGQSAIYRGGIEALCFQKTLHRFRAVADGPTPEFAQIVFRSHVKSGVFRRLASITTNIAHLTLEKFKAAPFPLPPKAEQQRIVVEVERLMSIGNAVDKAIVVQIARAEHLRQSILRRAFEGKLVPQDPNDGPASVLLDRIRQERASSTGKPPPGQMSLDLEKPKKPRASRRRSS
jgi:type I restriction enzyme S subunit